MITDQEVDEVLAEVVAELEAESCDGCGCPLSSHEDIDPYWAWYSRGALSNLKGCADCGSCCDPEDEE